MSSKLRCFINIIFVLLVIGIVIILLFLGVKIYKYHEARIICKKIKAGEDIETNFSNGSTAPIFLDNIAAIMQIDGPKIPLVEACYYRNVQAVEVLLENGADPNYFIEGRWSPLEAAVVNGLAGPIDEESFEIVKLLVDNGCDVNKHASSEPVIVHLSTIIGAGNDNKVVEDIFLYLLDNGADKKHNGYEKIFHDIVRSDNVQLARKLIEEYGFDVNGNCYMGRSPLIVAVTRSSETTNAEMIQLLLQSGANKSLSDDNGKTALDYAIENNDHAVVAVLTDWN